MHDYIIKNVHGHYEVYTKENDNFVVSADTYREAVNEMLLLSRQ